MLDLRRVDLEQCDWAAMDALADRTVFQTREWLEFVAATQGAEPVVAEVLDAGEVVGYFTGLIVQRYGVRILGSPFPGWTTGHGLQPARGDEPARGALAALPRFAFGELGCLHLEVQDRHLDDAEDVGGLGFDCTVFTTFEVDLDPRRGRDLRAHEQRLPAGRAQGREDRGDDRGGDGDGLRRRVLRAARRRLRQAVAAPDLRRRAGPRRWSAPCSRHGRLLLLRARDPDGRASPPASSRRSTARRTSGAARAGATSRSSGPTRRSSGTRCATGRRAGSTIIDMGGGGRLQAQVRRHRADRALPSQVQAAGADPAPGRRRADRDARSGLSHALMPLLRDPAAAATRRRRSG